MSDQERTQHIRDNASRTKLYKQIIDDLLDSPRLKAINNAKDKDDFATIEIWTLWLWSYIVQLLDDLICVVGKQHWREESEDMIREVVWIDIKRYTK